jgi:hypothetical protein
VLRPCTWGHSDRGLMIHKDNPDSMQLSHLYLCTTLTDHGWGAPCRMWRRLGHAPCTTPHARMPAWGTIELICCRVTLFSWAMYAVDSQIPLQCMQWVMVCYRGSLPMYNEGFAVTGHFIVGQCLISTENSWGASDAFNHVMMAMSWLRRYHYNLRVG